MRAATLLVAATLGVLGFACGTDNHGRPGSEKYPTALNCPVTTKALAAEDMAAKKPVAKTLSFTFDSGPSEQTEAIETFLAQQQIRATFFINGENVEGLENVLDLLKTDGHIIGNRSQTDEDVTMLDPTALVKSVTDTDAFIKDRMTPTMLFFRPPYGGWNADAQTALAASPMTKYTGPVGWDMGDTLSAEIGSDSECWDKEKSAQECGDLFLAQIREKKTGIVLLHDGPPGVSPKIVDMVKAIIPTLKSEGFLFARIDQLNLVPRSETFPGDDPNTGGPGTGTETGTENPCPTTQK